MNVLAEILMDFKMLVPALLLHISSALYVPNTIVMKHHIVFLMSDLVQSRSLVLAWFLWL